MKYIIILGDGMADYPITALDGRTPLEAAKKPYMDMLAARGRMGLVKTVPDDLPPGSDVANLSVFGYDPHKYYTGRSPLEAVSMGVALGDGDTAFRTNLVTLSDETDFAQKKMVDYSSDEISTDEAHILIQAVEEALGNAFLSFHGGISYRHLMLWHGCDTEYRLTPPHDISGRVVQEYLPGSPIILELMRQSHDVLKDHPVNIERIAQGKHPANTIWIWGQGKKPQLTPFAEKYGKKGAVISAVDLVKGIGICAGMRSIDVEGATGNIHTDFDAKARAAVDALTQDDFVYVHIEAPDECGHRFELENKVRAIELIDEKVVGPIYEALTAKAEAFSMLILPDHPTPLSLGTHTHDPVPFVLYRSGDNGSGKPYSEKNAAGGEYIPHGFELMDYLIGG